MQDFQKKTGFLCKNIHKKPVNCHPVCSVPVCFIKTLLLIHIFQDRIPDAALLQSQLPERHARQFAFRRCF